MLSGQQMFNKWLFSSHVYFMPKSWALSLKVEKKDKPQNMKNLSFNPAILLADPGQVIF